MQKGRSTYSFQITCDSNLINNLIQSYIQSNKFEFQQTNDEQFYRAGDALVEGYRFFKYSIVGQTLTIYAWFKYLYGEVPVEQNSLNIIAMNYRNSLNTLFQEINKLNNMGVSMNVHNNAFQQNQSNYQPPVQPDINQFSQQFQNETTNKQEQMCEIGFWLSIVGLLLSFMGIVYGAIVYILNFYFASQGLKTSKRTKAITTIILSIISIIIFIFQLL